MQASLNWLKEYVAVDCGPKELADLLTMSGSEVDSIIHNLAYHRGLER